MGDLFVVVLALLDLLLELFLALGGGGDFTGGGAVVDDVLHPGDLAIVDPLHAVEVVDAQVSDGVLIVAVHINKRLEAILLAAVKQPVDGALATAGDGIGAAMVFEKVI